MLALQNFFDAARANPARVVFPEADEPRVAEAMADYADKMTANNVPLHSITRHMLGLYAGQRGAKHWRRQLGEQARLAQDDGGFIRQTVEECEILAARLAA